MLRIIKLCLFLKEYGKKRDYPLVVNYDITPNCNLNCEHCYWKKTDNLKKEISDKGWEKIFLLQRKKGTNCVFLTGGEPALRINVIRIADRIFRTVSVVSNGTIKIPEDIQRRIFISIDGPEHLHNKIRGAKVYKKIIKNIQDDKRVVITPTLSRTNYRHIKELVDIARNSNVDGITFSTYASHCPERDPLLLKGDELDWTINELKKVLKKNKDIVWLSPSIIKLLKTKNHYKRCFMRNKRNIFSFDSNMNIKEPCTLGKGVNCRTCGCIVPASAYAMFHGDLKSWIIFGKFYPKKYSK